MSRPRKKILILLLKIAVLVCVVEYARRQAQIGDELAVRAVAGASLVTSSGPTVELAAGSRLKVERRLQDESGGALAYEAKAPDGSHFTIPAADVQSTQQTTAADDQRRFTLLPGMRTLFANLQLGWLGLGFLLFGPALFLMAVRWRILLLASGIEIPFFILVRLHYMGFFFNTFMPGGAGGDIIKAVYVARHCAKKAEAATMVVIDRVIGLIGLLAMAGTVVLFRYREMHGIGAQVGWIALSLLVGCTLYFSTVFRKLVRYEAVLARLPRADVLGRIDAALFGLRAHLGSLAGALALTILLQFLEVVGIWCAGQSIGLSRPRFTHYLAFVPIGYLFNALPISFGGIGLMEGAFLKLFRDAGVATATEGFLLGVLARVLVIGWSLVGAISMLFPPARGEVELVPQGEPAPPLS